MIPDLEHLLKLSNVDHRIHELRLSKKNLPAELARIQEALRREEENQRRMTQDLQRLDEAESRSSALIEQESAALSRSQERLNSITTNKEYDAIHAEIAAHRRQVEQATHAVHDAERRRETMRVEVAAAEEKATQSREKNQPEIDRIQSELDSIDARITTEQEKLAALRKNVSSRAISLYDRLVARKGSPEVIGIVLPDRKSCGVCQRVLPPQEYLQVQRNDGLRTCQSCGSILIYSQTAAV